MQTAIIFAILAGQPTILLYQGDLNQPYDERNGRRVTLSVAEDRIEKKFPVLLALEGGPVVRANENEALYVLRQWTAADKTRDFKRMRQALRTAGDHVFLRQKAARRR